MSVKSEPMVRISKRDGMAKWKSWLIRLIAVVISLVINAIIIYMIAGLNPLLVYKEMLEGVFGTACFCSCAGWIPIRTFPTS